MKRDNKLQTSAERFEMIAPLLCGGICAAEKRRLRLEIMEMHGISERTLRRHLENYRKEGLKGLEPAGRPETGTFKAITSEILDLAMQYKRELPERSVRSICILRSISAYVPLA